MANDPVPTFAFYWLLKARPTYFALDAESRRRAPQEFLRVLAERPSQLVLRGAYSMVGLRADADLLLWLYGPDLTLGQELAAALRRPTLGAQLDWPYAYTGVATPAQYDPTHSAAFVQGVPPRRYLSVYPFVKTAEWYLLSFEERRALMAEHGEVGRRFSVPRAVLAALASGDSQRDSSVAVAEPATGGGVLTNTIHSFGLGDQEFVVAFESDDAHEMVRMVEALRATAVRRYTKADTPIFLGVRKPEAEALADLG